MERIPSAFEAVRASSRTFLTFGDLTRETSAALAHAHLLFSTERFEDTYHLLIALDQRLRHSSDIDSHAAVLGHPRFGCSRMGRPSDAIRYHELASMLCSELGVHTEVVREKLNIATILATEGRLDEALAAFQTVRVEFSRLGMVMPAALAGLQVAEIMLS